MIIVGLSGGMGNQMFQYAFARCLAHRRQTELKLDLSFFKNQPPAETGHVFRNYDLDIFAIDENFATEEEVFRLRSRFHHTLLDKIANKIVGVKKSCVREPHFQFSESAYQSSDNVYLSGYWQTEKYFSAIRSLIQSDFTFKEPMTNNATELLSQILSKNSVCVNVRRGDFVTNSFHGSYGPSYFSEAERIMESKVADPTYFVFSDEIEWCRANLQFNNPTVFVSHEFAGRKFQDYLRLMSACKHFIIPNSSFAWWAVWFNENPVKTVIAPAAWFSDTNINTNDLVPADWIRI
jgi:hypothetical protein